MKVTSLEDVFQQQLKDLYSDEQQLIKALPEMAKAASAPELKNAFNHHCEQTKGHEQRLEQIGQQLNIKLRGEVCRGMEGIIKEAKETIRDNRQPSEALDAALIADAQRAEHYEIAGYGCVCTYAQSLGYPEAKTLLQQTLSEEEQTNELLTRIAESSVNKQAMHG
jgi:ferritin-like metal-binding protein YciE